jgi:iron complex transport system permease protein
MTSGPPTAEVPPGDPVTAATPAAAAPPGTAGAPGAGAAHGEGAPAPGPRGSGVPEAGSPGPAARGTGIGAAGGARRPRTGLAVAVATAALLAAVLAGMSIGPARLPLAAVAGSLLTRLPWHPHVGVPGIDVAIVWQVRLPRVVLGALVGAMLSGCGAAYQGVFRNPLVDPYLLGAAAGGGLGATLVIVTGAPPALLPPAAFAGAVGAVMLTYLLGSSAGERDAVRSGGGSGAIVLAGVAVTALLTAVQTYLQQQHTQQLQQIYGFILGGLSLASWSSVTLILPYVAVSAVLLLAHRRLLDVLRVGEVEAASLGVDIARLRLIVVAAATLGTAAAVSVSGLIGFVGIIVPHTVRLTAGASYRVVVPVSLIGGAAFMVAADIAARTVQAPAEVPIGVITAAAGAPFFLFVLRSRRARQELA